MNLEKICMQVVALSKEVGLYQKSENKKLTRQGIEEKGRNDYVTYVDKESESRIISGLSQILPGAGFLTEEGFHDLPEEEYFWIVDPLDGTSNYIHQLSPYAVSIALMQKNEILLGCIYEVTLDEAFYAWKNGKCWLNGEIITVSQTDTIENSMIAHGIPYKPEPRYEFIRNNLSSFYGIATLRHLGSAAAELCYVAAGRLDAYFHDSLSPWDVAAGAIIVREAGGKITDFSLGDNFIFGKELIATNGQVHEKLLNRIKAD